MSGSPDPTGESYRITMLHVLTAGETRVILEAAQHIEELCPRPGPYHPAFANFLRLAQQIKGESEL